MMSVRSRWQLEMVIATVVALVMVAVFVEALGIWFRSDY